ncbi:MAG TPA: thioredoxin family protein [Candidatus Xenobia bacterium]|nr:thioredoxin family protein [Candidatus Xenobia bacterium]
MFSESDRKEIRERLKGLTNPVKLIHFTQELDCEFCPVTRRLLEQLVELSDKLSLEVYNFQLDKEKVAQYHIDKVPATVLEGAKDYGIRFYGIPHGYEFATLLDSVLAVSQGESGLSRATVERLRNLEQPVHLQVFVTPTCPYCPAAVRLAHQFAIESDLVTADIVEATEFPDLVQRYGVRGVPFTVVNEEASIVGALPEDAFVQEMLRLLHEKRTTPARV